MIKPDELRQLEKDKIKDDIDSDMDWYIGAARDAYEEYLNCQNASGKNAVGLTDEDLVVIMAKGLDGAIRWDNLIRKNCAWVGKKYKKEVAKRAVRYLLSLKGNKAKILGSDDP